MTQEQVLEDIVRKVLSRLGRARKRVLILGPSECPTCKRVAAGYEQEYECFFIDAEQSFREQENLLRIVPYLTCKQMASLAVCTPNDQATEAITAHLQLGHRILVDRYEYEKYEKSASDGLMAAYREYRERLESFGLVPANQKRDQQECCSWSSGRLIQASDVPPLKRGGMKVLHVPEGVRITPLAADELKEAGINVIRDRRRVDEDR